MDGIAFLRAVVCKGLSVVAHGANEVFRDVSQFERHRIGVGAKLSLKHLLMKLVGQATSITLICLMVCLRSNLISASLILTWE